MGVGTALTLKMAWSVRRCKSVKTRRGFLGVGACSVEVVSSFRLQAEKKTKKEKGLIRYRVKVKGGS